MSHKPSTKKSTSSTPKEISLSAPADRNYFNISLPNKETAEAILRSQKKDIITPYDCYQKGDLLRLSVQDNTHPLPNDTSQHPISNILFEITFVSPIPFSASLSLPNPNGWLALSIQPFKARGMSLLPPYTPPIDPDLPTYSSISTQTRHEIYDTYTS